jgi:HKD family nuclease
VEWLAALPNVQVRVSRYGAHQLHAKAYTFGENRILNGLHWSANMSHAAITSGLEWNLKITAQDMRISLKNFHRV